MTFVIALIAGFPLLAQGYCQPAQSAFAESFPEIDGFGLEGTYTLNPPSTTGCPGGCTFSFEFHSRVTQPYAAGGDTFKACFNGGVFFCVAGPFVNVSGPTPPPFVYTFDYSSDDFFVSCGQSLEAVVYWNPGLGQIPIAGVAVSCNPSCPY